MRSERKYRNIYYLNSFRNLGVKNDQITYCLVHQNTIYTYEKPCVCGSLHHSSTRHHDCVLNVRYDDAILF